jgi:hypothetical protein
LPESGHFAVMTSVPATLRGGGHVMPCELAPLPNHAIGRE